MMFAIAAWRCDVLWVRHGLEPMQLSKRIEVVDSHNMLGKGRHLRRISSRRE
jgi:hypothetical protein